MAEGAIIPVGRIEERILLIRGERVMLDADLAALYGVQTKNLVKAVKRNIERFPEDFMFQLTPAEFRDLRFQFGTSNAGRGGRRYAPYAFTEHGAIMAASVLSTEQAVRVSRVPRRRRLQPCSSSNGGTVANGATVAPPLHSTTLAGAGG